MVCGRRYRASILDIPSVLVACVSGNARLCVVGYDMTDNPWRLPVDLRPAEQPEVLSVDARLIAAKVALSIVIGATNLERRHPETFRKWSQRDRLEYIATICENALRRVK